MNKLPVVPYNYNNNFFSLRTLDLESSEIPITLYFAYEVKKIIGIGLFGFRTRFTNFIVNNL